MVLDQLRICRFISTLIWAFEKKKSLCLISVNYEILVGLEGSVFRSKLVQLHPNHKSEHFPSRRQTVFYLTALLLTLMPQPFYIIPSSTLKLLPVEAIHYNVFFDNSQQTYMNKRSWPFTSHITYYILLYLYTYFLLQRKMKMITKSFWILHHILFKFCTRYI